MVRGILSQQIRGALEDAIMAGVTTVLDMGTVHEHDVVMDACARSGIRACSGKAMMDTGQGVPAGLRMRPLDDVQFRPVML